MRKTVELPLPKAWIERGQEPIAAGTLHIVGVGAWPVICGGE